MSDYYLRRNRKPLALTERHSVFQRERSYSCVDNITTVMLMSIKAAYKNDPRLGGSLLDVMPRQLEGIQPLDTTNIARHKPYANEKNRGQGR